MLNLKESIQFLRCRQLPLTPNSAINYLLNISHQYLLLGLYQHLFPTEYLNSQAQTQRQSNCDELEEMPSEREQEFLELVNSKLFPLDQYWVDEWVESGYALSQIPLNVFGINFEDTSLDDFGLGQQLLILLTNPDFTQETYFPDSSIVHQWAMEQIPKGEINFPQFKRLCQSIESPLIGAALAIEMLSQNTGNIFLDCHDPEYICESDRSWSVANINFWTQHWQEADAMLTQINNFLMWLEDDPITNFTQLVQGVTIGSKDW
ncbi:MAG TPA: hypothetical protein DD379_22190 [Cyanobacteria bacterium UBA11162]|nr:hypothetical protein [Cyanobacteria bacterium UBA11162]